MASDIFPFYHIVNMSVKDVFYKSIINNYSKSINDQDQSQYYKKYLFRY